MEIGALSPNPASKTSYLAHAQRNLPFLNGGKWAQRTNFHLIGLVCGLKLGTSIFAEIKSWAHPYAVFNKLPKNRAR